jgi:hypothetical protein
MANSRIARVVIVVLVIAQAATAEPCLGAETAQAQTMPRPRKIVTAGIVFENGDYICSQKYARVKFPLDKLPAIVKQHESWLAAGGAKNPTLANDPRRANLCGTNLEGANLLGADLSGAYLLATHLNGAHLNGAELEGAHLNGAYLYGTQVSKAGLAYADLKYASYAPASEPPDPYVAGIKGLATINAASGEEVGLIQLRKLLQDAGLRDGVREATFSIQNNITRD